ncbi:MAG: hypothetical protein ACFB0B_14970 [Thermonemataceae bacterium]
MKKIIIGIICLAIWLPFIATTHFYPFLRFGMYAEPVRKELEYFRITFKEKAKGPEQAFDVRILGFDERMMNYLIRDYYYQDKMSAFERKLQESCKSADWEQSVASWQIWQIHVTAQGVDSAQVATFDYSRR